MTRSNIRKRIVSLGILVLVVLVLWYGFITARKLIFGPSIHVTTPQDGAVVTQEPLTISGTALRTQDLYINDRLVLIEQDGTFTDSLLVPPGYSILTLTARDRFGHTTETQIRVWHPKTKPATTTSTTTATTTYGEKTN